MSKASDAFDKLFGVVFFADEEHGISDDFDTEAEGFVYTAGEAEEVSKGTAAGQQINFKRGVFGLLFKYGVYDRCRGVRGILCGVQVAKVMPTVLFQTLWSS